MPSVIIRPGPWMFFTADEAATVEAAVDRLIPPDNRGHGVKDAGCAVFIDRQLAGPYGRSDGLDTEKSSVLEGLKELQHNVLCLVVIDEQLGVVRCHHLPDLVHRGD